MVAPSLNLRPVMVLVVLAAMTCLVPLLVAALGAVLANVWRWFLCVVLPPIFTLGVLSVFLSLVLGEKVGHRIGEIWMAAFRLAVSTIELVIRLLGRMISR